METDLRVGEDVGTLQLRTRLSRAVEGMTYTITYGITSGTAVSPGDYDAPSSVIPVVVGEGQTEIIMDRVDIIDDDVPEEDESFTVRLEAVVSADLPITVSPVTGKGTATVTIVNDDVVAEIADARATEGNDAVFAVTADAPGFILPVDAVYEVTRATDDTIENDDVQTGRFTERWTDGNRLVRTLTVPTRDDTDTDNEQFTVRLVRIGNATLRRAEAKGTIFDRAITAYPVLTLTPSAIAENAGTVAVTATLSEPVSEAITVTIAASPEDAHRLSGSGTIAFAADSTTSTDSVTLTATDNDVFEGNVTVRVRGAVSGSSEVRDAEPAELTIQEDEDAPVVNIRKTQGGNLAEGTSTHLLITLTPASADTIRVNHRGTNNTAEEGIDYAPITGQVVFAPGETEKRITLTAIDDDHFDLNEQLTVEITLPEGQRAILSGDTGTPPRPTVMNIIIADDDSTTIGFEEPLEVTVNEDAGELVLYLVFDEQAQWHSAAVRRVLLSHVHGTTNDEDYEFQSQAIDWTRERETNRSPGRDYRRRQGRRTGNVHNRHQETKPAEHAGKHPPIGARGHHHRRRQARAAPEHPKTERRRRNRTQLHGTPRKPTDRGRDHYPDAHRKHHAQYPCRHPDPHLHPDQLEHAPDRTNPEPARHGRRRRTGNHRERHRRRRLRVARRP